MITFKFPGKLLLVGVNSETNRQYLRVMPDAAAYNGLLKSNETLHPLALDVKPGTLVPPLSSGSRIELEGFAYNCKFTWPDKRTGEIRSGETPRFVATSVKALP